jgi:hypothetical protein
MFFIDLEVMPLVRWPCEIQGFVGIFQGASWLQLIGFSSFERVSQNLLCLSLETVLRAPGKGVSFAPLW